MAGSMSHEQNTSEYTIIALRDIFARYGLPRQLVSDNGPQFTYVEFDVYLPATFVVLPTTRHPMVR